jgi:hypothetical protein
VSGSVGAKTDGAIPPGAWIVMSVVCCQVEVCAIMRRSWPTKRYTLVLVILHGKREGKHTGRNM